MPAFATRLVTVTAAPLLMAGAAAMVVPAAGAAAATRTLPAAQAALAAVSFSGQLHGVAATSAKNAWAVGSAGTTTHPKTLIVRWNGSSWRQVSSPSPSGSMLRAVAATSASNAWAVGCSSCLTSHPKALILHWNGASWKQVASPGGGLSGVAAVSARYVWAVGSTTSGKTLIVRWNGRSWRQVSSPSPSSAKDGNSLAAVTAVSARAAWAVGYSTNGSGSLSLRSLILRWNGSAWKRVSMPAPTFGKYGYALSGVAATSATSAWAVGCTDGCPVGGTPLIERWRGNSWKQVAAPTKPYAIYNLVAVAATSATSAWTVGGGGPVTSEAAATAHWNGRAWTLSHGISGAGLAGVAGVSASDAWAVGGTTKGRTLILHWNGSSWQKS